MKLLKIVVLYMEKFFLAVQTLRPRASATSLIREDLWWCPLIRGRGPSGVGVWKPKHTPLRIFTSIYMSLPYIPYNRSNADRAKSMRKEMTRAEQRMWFEILQKRPGGYKFLRQKMIGSYILDFYCSKLMLAIEIDGDSHAWPDAEKYDSERTAFLKDLWITVIRYTNEDVYNRIDDVERNMLGYIWTN